MKFLVYSAFGFLSFWSFGQKGDTLDEVVILPFPKSSCAMELVIPKKTIENQLVSDVGQLMQFIPGVQLKAYGDIGGLKTVSFRSLGAGHTVFVQDFQTLSTTQSGQADLSQIPTEFIHKLSFNTLSPVDISLPLHAKLGGAIIHVESKHVDEDQRSTNLIVGIQAGSFGAIDGTLFGKIRSKKWSWSTSGKARSYQGNYPFSYRNGNTLEQATRKNNGLFDAYGASVLQFSPNAQHRFRLLFQANIFQKELAGAVIFYNPSIAQYLGGYGMNGSLQHTFQQKHWQTFTRLNVQANNLKYVDSSYLNAQGYLDNRYMSTQFDGDFQVKRVISEQQSLVLGTGCIHEKLIGNSLSTQPERTTQDNYIGYQWDKRIVLNAQIGVQGIFETRKMQATKHWFVLPAASIGLRISKNQQIAMAYRFTNRQPTFSELYYQQLGNTDLKIEKAQIASIRYHIQWIKAKWNCSGIVEPFFSEVKDKILAIPTKNLFIWSILNIGKTQAYGSEVTVQFNYFLKKSTIGFRTNYTYQEAFDLTEKSGPTYKHTLSYSPKHTGSLQLNWTKKHLTVFTQIHTLSSRYTMNQNIPENILPGFYSIDLGAGYKLALKKGTLLFNVHLRNLTNNYFSFVNYFILPGINGQIRIAYVL